MREFMLRLLCFVLRHRPTDFEPGPCPTWWWRCQRCGCIGAGRENHASGMVFYSDRGPMFGLRNYVNLTDGVILDPALVKTSRQRKPQSEAG